MANFNATRGFGLLEGFLAKKRAQKANSLIPQHHRSGRILDIGTGAYPVFLLKTSFFEKFGIDKAFPSSIRTDTNNHPLTLMYHDIESEDPLPFNDEYFDVVTMLAVFEHINPQRLPKVFQEVNRILKRGGILIITTPAEWTGFILSGMARFRLVSNLEIGDHKRLYSAESIVNMLKQCGFPPENIQFGSFELHMNTWATAMR
jgi:SAM-dependent methyltransferase